MKDFLFRSNISLDKAGDLVKVTVTQVVILLGLEDDAVRIKIQHILFQCVKNAVQFQSRLHGGERSQKYIRFVVECCKQRVVTPF